ncbi:hypothetical protein LCGC14_0182030, partial [marine sediment metagenome]
VLSMHKTPRAFAFHVWMLAVFYNNAFVVPEANTYGASMIECLRQGNAEKRQEAYTRLYRPTAEGDYREKERTRYGWYMTKESKLRAIDEFGEAIRDGQLIINAREVGNEMRNYIGFEDSEKFSHHLYPSTSTFLAIYFTITGLHGLHIIGGLIVNGYFLGPGSKMWATDPERFTNRIEIAGLYWHFVDLVWIFLFPVFYLL